MSIALFRLVIPPACLPENYYYYFTKVSVHRWR